MPLQPGCTSESHGSDVGEDIWDQETPPICHVKPCPDSEQSAWCPILFRFFSERASDKKGTCFFAGYHTEADSVRIHSVKCRGAFGGYQYYILDIFTIIQINSASAGADPLRNGTRSRQHFPSRTLPLPHYRARHVQAPVSAAFTILPCPPTRTEIFPFSLPSIPSMYPSRLFCRHSLSFPRADGFIRPQPAKKALHEG